VKPFFIDDGIGKGLKKMLSREKDMPEDVRKKIEEELKNLENDDYIV
jgi:hypothetical protein